MPETAEHRCAQRVQAGERELHLGLDARRPGDPACCDANLCQPSPRPVWLQVGRVAVRRGWWYACSAQGPRPPPAPAWLNPALTANSAGVTNYCLLIGA